MQKKLPFFFVLMSVAAVFVFSVDAQAQYHRSNRDYDHKERKHDRRDDRRQREQTIIITPSRNQIYRTSNTTRNNSYYRNDNNYRTERYYENNRSGSVAQMARLHGYHDGLHEGAKDARDGDRYDPFAESDYRDADQGYRSRYGNKAEYKQIYRQGFIQGYREAFNRYLGNIERNW